MSRAHESGNGAAAIAGTVALPLPTGDIAELRAAARSLDRAAARALSTTTVRGTLGTRLGAVWTGDAAAAARREADELGVRSRRLVDALPVASRSLLTYAAALDHAIARVRSLQHQWDALDAEHSRTALHLASLPDPTGAIGALGLERSRAEQSVGRARLSRSYAGVLDELRATARRCAGAVVAVTDVTLPPGDAATAAGVRVAVTGGLWFADGVVATRESRSAGLTDSTLVRQAMARAGGPAGVEDSATAQIASRLRSGAEDPVYAQTLLAELGADGVAQLLLSSGVTRNESGTHVDTVRGLLAAVGSLLLTATSHQAPAGTDPRTRAQLASGAALLADDLVVGVDTVRSEGRDAGPGPDRATGAWLLGQMLSGARAAGDHRRLPSRLARRAAAAAATAEIAESRDRDATMSHGSTLRAGGTDAFASWFDDVSRTGDPVHVLLQHVDDDPAPQVALLAEPLPESAVAGGALANARGDRLTLGEHLVRRWITHEANGIRSLPDLRLATDDDLARLLPSLSAEPTIGAVETRARIMLEVSRTSRHAMLEASTTRIYTNATAPIEELVGTWVSAMRDNIDLALTSPVPTSCPAARYAAPTTNGMQPWLDPHELTGVVGALAVDSGTGLHARDTGAAYDRLVDRELGVVQQSVQDGSDVRHDLVRLGFFDQSASAALVGVARRQDELNRAAWQGLAETAHVIGQIRRGGLWGVVGVVQRYAEGGRLRTPTDDLLIALARSNVELEQTERDDARRAALAGRIEALTGGVTDVPATMAVGAGRAPRLATAAELRAARSAEIRTALDGVLEHNARGGIGAGKERLEQPSNSPDGVHVVDPLGDAPAPRPRGIIDERLKHDIAPHERATAACLADHGYNVTFLPEVRDGKSADALIDGELWEFKRVNGESKTTVVGLLRHAREQSSRIVLDLAITRLSLEEVMRQIDYTLSRYDRITVVRVITKDKRIIERTP